ncbi:hypothetical protein EDC01DRAFT_746949 [Geopyxis carbonaria]|nr:hypothetical protein EDC01DRAFT_746949 [Geopyxis carbonaria]
MDPRHEVPEDLPVQHQVQSKSAIKKSKEPVRRLNAPITPEQKHPRNQNSAGQTLTPIQSNFLRKGDGLRRKPIVSTPLPRNRTPATPRDIGGPRVVNTQRNPAIHVQTFSRQNPIQSKSGTALGTLSQRVLQDSRADVSFSSRPGSFEWKSKIRAWSAEVAIAVPEDESRPMNLSDDDCDRALKETVADRTHTDTHISGLLHLDDIDEQDDNSCDSRGYLRINADSEDKPALVFDEEDHDELRQRVDQRWEAEKTERYQALKLANKKRMTTVESAEPDVSSSAI